jgi:hypothetical protein
MAEQPLIVTKDLRRHEPDFDVIVSSDQQFDYG